MYWPWQVWHNATFSISKHVSWEQPHVEDYHVLAIIVWEVLLNLCQHNCSTHNCVGANNSSAVVAVFDMLGIARMFFVCVWCGIQHAAFQFNKTKVQRAASCRGTIVVFATTGVSYNCVGHYWHSGVVWVEFLWQHNTSNKRTVWGHLPPRLLLMFKYKILAVARVHLVTVVNVETRGMIGASCPGLIVPPNNWLCL